MSTLRDFITWTSCSIPLLLKLFVTIYYYKHLVIEMDGIEVTVSKNLLDFNDSCSFLISEIILHKNKIGLLILLSFLTTIIMSIGYDHQNKLIMLPNVLMDTLGLLITIHFFMSCKTFWFQQTHYSNISAISLGKS